MDGLDRSDAIDRLESIVSTIESDEMPVPVREVWTFGDVALGLDPIDRLDVYVTKDVVVRDEASPDVVERFLESHGIDGVGKTVRASWAEAHPEHLRSNANGHAAPERCLAAHLLDPDEPVHLEVCNTSFEHNVKQRLRGATLREDYTQLLDPRGVCLWIDGVHSETAFQKLRDGSLVLPTLPEALEMLDLEPETAQTAAETYLDWRHDSEGMTVRGDIV